MFIDFNDREKIFEFLSTLKPDTPALFGKMNAQQMVEHLAFATKFSNGKNPQQQHTPPELAAKIKDRTIYSDRELSKGVRVPAIGEEPFPAFYPDMEAAIQAFRKELEDFDLFFEQNPDSQPIQPHMGPMNHAEWKILWGKHITHHFKQFGLIK